MKIRYFGHACFCLDGSAGKLILDPFTGIGYEMSEHEAAMVLCSHNHYDHHALEKVETDQVLETLFDGEIEGLKIESVSTYHDEANGAKRGTCIVFKLTYDGVSVAHLGDIGFVDERVIDFCKGVDVLLVPVGGYYTVDAKDAKALADRIGAKTVIPMHYKTGACSISIAPLGDFTSLYPSFSTVESGIDAASLPQGIVVMNVDADA